MRRKAFISTLLALVGVAEAEARTMDVTISIPDADGLGLIGIVPISIEAHPTANLRFIQILIDGALMSQQASSPLTYQWDTTKVVDGTHIIQGIAQYRTRKSQAQIAVTVKNAAVEPPPPPPPPPPITNAVFDGRAARMNALTGSTILGNNDAFQDPEVWGHIGDGDLSEGLYFMGDDIRLVNDPDYGKVYYVETNGYSQNPYWTDADVCSAEMTHDYQLVLGEEMWFTGVTKLDPSNVLTSWQTLQQVAYPTLSSPPFGFYMHLDGFGIERHYGPIPSVGQQASGYDNKMLHPWDSIKGKWIEYMCAVKMAVDSSGSIRVWTRVRTNGETDLTLRYEAMGVTFQWIDGQAPKLSVMDKLGHYWGYTGDKSGWPTNRVWHRGWMRFADEVSARANLG